MNAEALEHKPLAFALSPIIWVIVGLLVGSAFALTGSAGVFVAAALGLLIVFGAVAARFPVSVMGAAIFCLGLVPYDWGLQTGVIPKVFGDEALLLFYLALLPFLYLFTKRFRQQGFSRLYVVLAALLCGLSLSFVGSTDLVAIRNFVETMVLGSLLLVLVLQEASQTDPEAVGNFVVATTVVVAALSVIERVIQINPIMEGRPYYLSPELARITEGFYRPYVTFFHPSETGTFMALGAPFVFAAWMNRKTLFSVLALLIVAVGLFVNGTRGVWFGVLFAALIGLRYAWAFLLGAIPVATLGAWLGYVAFKSSPFVQRITDPRDLYARFEYWQIAGRIFVDHPLIGVGHMQFNRFYLDYVPEVTNPINFDFARVNVADNMFLMTAVENGFLGFAVLVVFLLFAGLSLRRYRKRLLGAGLKPEATFVRCSEMALIIYIVTGCFADICLFTKATKYLFIIIGLGLATGIRYTPRAINLRQ